MEVYVDDDAKLTLNGLQQYYVKLKENEKNRKLFDLLDNLEFNQVCLFECLSIVSILLIMLLGGHFRQVRATLYCTQQLALDTGLPVHWGPSSNAARRASQSLSSIQELWEAYFGCNRLVRSWNWYRESEHCVQLWHGRELGHLFASCKLLWREYKVKHLKKENCEGRINITWFSHHNSFLIISQPPTNKKLLVVLQWWYSKLWTILLKLFQVDLLSLFVWSKNTQIKKHSSLNHYLFDNIFLNC